MKIKEYIEEDPESLIISLYNRASKYVWTSTTLYPDFYNRPSVKDAIINAAKKVDYFLLLHDSSVVDWDDIKERMHWITELVDAGKIILRKSLRKLRHWLIIDGDHFRLEKKHLGNTLTPKNLMIWNAQQPIADRLLDTFSRWWQNADTIH